MTTPTLPLDGERLLQIARDTGLRSYLHGVSATDARELLTAHYHRVIAEFLERSGQWLTNQGTHEEYARQVRDHALEASALFSETAVKSDEWSHDAQCAGAFIADGLRALKGTPAAAVADAQGGLAQFLAAAERDGVTRLNPAVLLTADEMADAQPIELQGVAETLADGGGFWRSCSGCHELNEGVDTGPMSDVLGCNLGNGCSECGGIGAAWDTTDYQAMADSMAASMNAAPQPSSDPGLLAAVEQDIDARVEAEFRKLGDDDGQGLDEYFKKAFRRGFIAAIAAIREGASHG